MPNSLKCKIKHLRHNGTLTERECDRILNALEQQPTRPTGRWIDIQYFKADDTYYRPKCPFCSIEPKEYSNYCPNCGAKMTESEGKE